MRIKGWQKVLKFTYIQIIKSKSFIASTSIMLAVIAIMLLAANYLPGLLADRNENNAEDSETQGETQQEEYIDITDDEGNVIERVKAHVIKKTYILDNSGLDIDYSFLSDLKIEYEFIDKEQSQTIMQTVTDSSEAVVLTVIETGSSFNRLGFGVRMSRPESTDLIKNSDCNNLLGAFSNAIRETNLIRLGIPEEDIDDAFPFIRTAVNVNGETSRGGEVMEAVSMTLTLVTSLVLFVLIIAYGQLTAQAIATEKASRVMELLLTSVKPLAVIVGKVIGTLLVALTSIVVIGGVGTMLFLVLAPTGSLSQIDQAIAENIDTENPVVAEAITSDLGTVLGGFNTTNIILIIVIFIMGFLFFSLIAGLIGATVSKIEDLQTALQPLMLISALGFYLTYFSAFTGLDPDGNGNAVVTLSWYLPISSPFALPSAIIAGKIGGTQLAVAIGVLALFLVLFALFVAKVYEQIILHNGNRLKIKDIVKLAKNKG